jgi:hypothetical protein
MPRLPHDTLAAKPPALQPLKADVAAAGGAAESRQVGQFPALLGKAELDHQQSKSLGVSDRLTTHRASRAV